MFPSAFIFCVTQPPGCGAFPLSRSLAALLGCCCSSSVLLAGSPTRRLFSQVPVKAFANAELTLLTVGGLLLLLSATALLSTGPVGLVPSLPVPPREQEIFARAKTPDLVPQAGTEDSATGS